MIKKLTQKADKVLSYAMKKAAADGQENVGTEYLLQGLVNEKNSTAGKILQENGVKLEQIKENMDLIIDHEKKEKVAGSFTPKVQKILDLSEREADKYGNSQVGTEHILLALLNDPENYASRLLNIMGINIQKIYVDVLMTFGIDLNKAKNLYMTARGKKGREKKSAPYVEQFTHDLTKYAREGKLDPVVGRQDAITRMLQIICRRNKNNPCLIGEPGVGKTALVEGVAQMLANHQVPSELLEKRICSLDLSALVAGTKYRGEFEDRIKKLLQEVKGQGDILLFIDEIHTIIGAGGAEGALDAANILKPVLARGEIQIIGATTIEEYRKYIEKDSALERRFQPVVVEEPTIAQTIDICMGLKDRYEEHHHLEISDEAVESAANLSERYINDRFLPDKAIDLIDEAASRKRIQYSGYSDEIINYKADLKEMTKNKEASLISGEFEKASEYAKKEKEIKQKIEKYYLKQDRSRARQNLIVGPDDVANVVSIITKIPVNKIKQEESKKLLNLEQHLHKRVIGQDEAVTAVAKAVKRGRVGIKEPNHPIGSFLFLGPTGVGKTELSKTLADEVFGSENNIIRVDMSEYMEQNSVSKMIGSPPGYVGYDEGGQLSEKVRRNPYSVILFDEIEKAHPDVFNILLQVLDDGHITDSQGRKVSFKNTIIIMTSNIGASNIVSPKKLGFTPQKDEKADHENMKQNVLGELKKAFKPEFINRIDEIIVFHALGEKDLKEITKLLVENVAKRTKRELGIEIKCDYHAINYLIEKGTDEKYGARPLKRAVQQYLEDGLAEEIIRGKVKKGDIVMVSTKNKKIAFSVKES